jgi:hypothetical protein
MTSGDNRKRATRRLAAALRWGGAVVAAGALAALGIVNSSSPARAASNPSAYDQMSGTGNTASAITVPWKNGLLNASNQPITTPGSELNPNADRQNGTGQYAFMTNGFTGKANGQSYTDDGAFNKLTVNVSQTQDIGHAGITVSWTGGLPTNEALASGGFLQIMECYGNAPSGPSPEDCEFGEGTSPVPDTNLSNTRVGYLCSSQTLSTANPTGDMSGNSPATGCDPQEPTVSTHGGCSGGVTTQGCADNYSIPFDPVDGSTPLYASGNQLGQAFTQFSTNEVDFATTDSTGAGQQQFETLTDAQSSGLGCAEQQSDGTPQGCWLVIVPRGVYEPNGYNVLSSTSAASQAVTSSPLSSGNWAQRIQVHLDYAQLPNFCPLGGKNVSLMEGTQLITRAVQSWELKLNQDANCSLTYDEAQTSEQQVTKDFSTALTPNEAANGLAFTNVPIGDDRLRDGEPVPALPDVVYAPVAVMALDFGFHIDMNAVGSGQGGYLTTAVKLTPQLLARALTQSYLKDLTDYDTNGQPADPGPAWAAHNPLDLSHDPQFEALNTEVIPYSGTNSIAPLDTVDHSAYYQQIWNWVQADSASSTWLDGASNSTVTVDPNYKSQQLGKSPDFDSIPRSYPCEFIHPLGAGGSQEQLCSIDMLPYVSNFDTASANVLAGNSGTFDTDWNPNEIAPDGSEGYWAKTPVEVPGGTWVWAIDATPYTAAYGIVPAELCNDSDSNCVGPTAASVTAAVTDAKPDSDGLLQVNPASPGTGAYPLTEVIYAAVRTDMPASALSDYASFISFAANQGQTPGQAGGDLPPGYLPLTSSLQAQANAAVAKLRSIAGGGTTTTTSPSGSTSSSATSTPTSGGPSTGAPAAGSNTQPAGTSTTTPATTPNPTAGTSPVSAASACATPTATPTATATPTPASTCGPSGPVITPPTIQLAAGDTPGQPVGPIRQVLVVVVIVGVAGAGGGILLRRGRLPRWPGRSRP